LGEGGEYILTSPDEGEGDGGYDGGGEGSTFSELRLRLRYG
jgi:hypothetical protein